jgi:hypothetical protein
LQQGRNIIVERLSGGKLLSLHGSQEKERERDRERERISRTRYIVQRHNPSDLFSPSRPQLLITHSAMNSSVK